MSLFHQPVRIPDWFLFSRETRVEKVFGRLWILDPNYSPIYFDLCKQCSHPVGEAKEYLGEKG